MDKNRALFAAILICLSVGLLAVAATGRASERSREYFVAVEPQKSDTVRMIEAYERLSSQYLTLVQQNLTLMAAANRDILDKLNAMDKKLDELAARLNHLEQSSPQHPSSQ